MSAAERVGSPHKRKRSRKQREASPPPPVEEEEEEVAKKIKIEHEDAKEEWKKEDLNSLFERLAAVLPKDDTIKYQTQAEKIDWAAIEFGEHSAESCKSKWIDVTTKLRKFRTMTELLVDAKEWAKAPWNSFGKKKTKHPDMPKKPLTPYFRFFIEKRSKYSAAHPGLSMTDLSKVVAKKFHELSEKKKKKYVDQYNKENEEYKIELEKFKQEHPEETEYTTKVVNGVEEKVKPASSRNPAPPKTTTAMQIFIDGKASEHMRKDPNATRKQCYELYRAKWQSLPDSKKMKYIIKSQEAFDKYETEMKGYMEKYPDHIPKEVKTFLTKAEQKIRDRSEGKPDKPPSNGYGLFTSELLSSMKEIPSQQRMGEVAVRWKALTDAVKDKYNKEAARKNEEYKENYEKYLSKMSPEERAKLADTENTAKSKKTEKVSNTPQESSARSNKPLNAMFLWMDEKRTSYQEKYPEMSHTEITRHMAQAWNKLSEEKKEKYREKELKQKKLNAEQPVVKETTSTTTKSSKNVKFPGEPKKPPGSGYQLFSTELLIKLKDIPTNDRMREISRRWHAMSEKERLGYKEKRDKAFQKYLKELESFKKKLSAKDRQKYEELQQEKKTKKPTKKKLAEAGAKAAETSPTKNKKKSATVLEEDGKTEELSEFSSSEVDDSDDSEEDSDSSDESSDEDSSEYESDNEEGAAGTGATEQQNGVREDEDSSSGEEESDSSGEEEDEDGDGAGDAAGEDGQKESSSEAESSSAEESGEESEEE